MKLAPPTPRAADLVTMQHFVPNDDDLLGEDEFDTSRGHASMRRVEFKAFGDIKLAKKSRYVVKGIVPAAALVVVWGPPKCGKSFFVFDMVAHVAAGWEYRGRRVKQVPVVYFALEGQEGFVARVQGLRLAHEKLPSDLPFYLSADRIVLPQDGAAVIAAIRAEFPAVKPGVVVLDTLNRSIAGSENDPLDMGQYVRAADMIREEFGCAVIVIHHCGTDGNRPRGHTSLTGAADAQIAVKRDELKNIIAKVEYMKDGPEGEEIVSMLEQVIVGTDEDGEAITSCVVWPTETTRSKSKATGQNLLALNILKEIVAEEGEAVAAADIPANTRTCSELAWRTKCYAKMFQKDTAQTSKQRGFVRAAKALQAQHLVGKYGDRVWPA